MKRVAEVIINRPSKKLNRTFSYIIPENLSFLQVGWRCIIPFGNKTEEGIILSIREIDTSTLNYSLKDVKSPIDSFAWFTPEMIQTALWISSYYFCTVVEALRLFYIDKKGIKTKTSFQIHWDIIPSSMYIHTLIDESVTEIYEEDFIELFTKEERKELLEKKYVSPYELIKAVHKDPLERWISIDKEFPVNEKRKLKQSQLATYLKIHGDLPLHEVEKAGFSMNVIREFCKNKFGHLFYKNKKTYSLIKKEKENYCYTLTPEQEIATSHIISAVDKQKYKGFLLKGVTGSGKTEVYVRAADHALSMGGMVLILVPEIALTLQMVDYFAKHFGDDVVFMHSNLSKGERYNNRMRIERGDSHVVIGSRSALFMPFKNLRLLIVDEEYDSSYKQEETPRYNGRDVAKVMAVQYQCPIVLGAATPSISSYHAAKQHKVHLITMNHRVFETSLPHIQIIDMKQPQAVMQSSIFSDALIDLIDRTIKENKKVILLLNRRGYAPTLLCKSCGKTFKCPHCDVSLVYHKDKHRLQCHYCEAYFNVPQNCNVCNGNHILFLGKGTQKLEESLNEIFPDARIARFDTDSTQKKHNAASILNDFRIGKYDILIGTQMVAKGHDISNVHAVGIIDIDNILNLPTYLASEQAFTLITQCAGRAGREKTQGQVILQTYNPEHNVIQLAAQQNYEAFYNTEIEYRKALQYPPFCKMMKITCFAKNYSQVKEKMDNIYFWLVKDIQLEQELHISLPYDEPVKKRKDTYYRSITIKGKCLIELKNVMKQSNLFLENGIIIDIDPL